MASKTEERRPSEAPVLDLELDNFLGEAASKAIQKMFPQLRRAVTKDEVPDYLFAEGVLTQSTFELSTNVGLSDSEKGRKYIIEIQHLVGYNPEKFETFCKVLEEHGHGAKDLIKKLRDTYVLKKEEAKEQSQSKLEIEFQELKDNLEKCKTDLSQPDAPQNELDAVIKFKIKSFITLNITNGATKVDIHNKIWTLCYQKFTIPTKLCTWALQTVEEAAVSKPKPANVEDVTSSEVAKPETIPEHLSPLPTSELKELLYNSSLCCQAVSTCNVGTYQQFFSDLTNPHLFEEISMSISDDRDEVDRYLVAVHGRTIYVAFQSEPNVQQWMTKYSSFSDGLDRQAGRIPFVFFWEKLRQRKRIVLTGFSYGGMLACFVAAILWKDSCIPIEALEQNVVCITYGQPVISIPCVQQVIKDIPHFHDTIYCVFEKADVLPSVSRYFNCIPRPMPSNQSGMTALSSSTAQPSATALGIDSQYSGTDQNFKEHGMSQQFLDDLYQLQKSEVSYSTVASGEKSEQVNALGRIKKVLEDAQPSCGGPDETLLCGNYCYQLIEKENQEVTWTAIPSKKLASLMFGSIPKIATESLEISSFWKHKMSHYRVKMLKAYLLNEPDKFQLPETQNRFTQVPQLKPDVSHVSVHFFPNEHAVVLEGENLSFCFEVQLGEQSNALKIKSPDHLTSRIIQFNFPPDKKTRNITILDDSTMKVTLRSHFSNPIRKRVKVNKESFTFSLREIQIAKYSPTEVIRLAFMSAMLERFSFQVSGQGPSHRLKSITRFLEEAVKVVPLESIFFAVAYTDDTTSIECAKALSESRFKFPPSESMCDAASIAQIRMETGIHGHVIESYAADAIRQASPHVPTNTGRYKVQTKCTSRNELQLTVFSPSPATYSEAFKQHFQFRRHPHLIPLPSLSFVFNTSHIPRSKKIYSYLGKFFNDIIQDGNKIIRESAHSLDELSNLSIEHIYPISSQRRHSLAIPTFQSPLDILQKGRENLESFIEESQEDNDSSQQHLTNEKMLELVKDIFDKKVMICATLLGAFMEQQIKIPLFKDSQKSTAEFLSSKNDRVAMGVWALFSSTFEELQEMLSSMEGNPLIVEIRDYIAGVLSDDLKKKKSQLGSKYDGKLQFLLCSQRVVTCSSEYISYSLEHQLCSKPKFDKSLSVKELIDKWENIFEGDALAFVAASHRPLIARWLKWAMLIHDLRLSLASYTCVGVTGLVNSGKSQLINKLFGIKTQVGTLEKTRTTVPLLYNLDGVVDGLDVIDFPGVDDKDNNIPKLAEMLLGLAQVVVFVCDHKRIFTDQAKQWLEQLKKEDVPVILCLTFADELYLHFIGADKNNPEPTEYKRREIGHELERKLERIGHHASRKVGFYCFHVPAGYKAEVNHKNLEKMGIGSSLDVGYELVKVFEKTLKQEDVAKQLKDRIDKLSSEARESTL